VSKQASNKDTESLYDRYLRGTAMTHTDLAALAKAWEIAVDSYQLGIMPADDVKAAHTAFHAAVAANAAEIERLTKALEELLDYARDCGAEPAMLDRTSAALRATPSLPPTQEA
jgi:outer membrane protein TolC